VHASPAADEPAKDGNGAHRRTIAYLLGGAGVIGVGIGTYFGFRAKYTYDDALAQHCPRGLSSCDSNGVAGVGSAHSQGNVSTVAFIAGGAAVAGAVVVYLTRPRSGSVAVRGSVGPRDAGLHLGGCW
jgi:serine/threonine-protein kinase